MNPVSFYILHVHIQSFEQRVCFFFQVDYPRFNLPKNVANLIYGQALVWLVAVNPTIVV